MHEWFDFAGGGARRVDDKIGRSLPTDPWHRPVDVAIVEGPTQVVLDPVSLAALVRGPWVSWRVLDTAGLPGPLAKPPLAGLLDDFLALEAAGAEAVAGFVRRWGPVRFDDALRSATRAGATPLGQAVRPPAPWDGWLPVALMRYYAGHLRGILAVAVNLQTTSDGIGAPADWERIFAWPGRTAPTVPSREVARIWLRDVVTELLDDTGPILGLRWPMTEDAPALTLSGGVFSQLVGQLVTQLVGADRIGSCSACGDLYRPTRRPQSGRRNYCQACGTNASKRDSKRRVRERAAADRRARGFRTRRVRTPSV